MQAGGGSSITSSVLNAAVHPKLKILVGIGGIEL